MTEPESQPDGMYDRILLASDGSPEATNAVEYGFKLAAAFDADVDLLSVVDPEVWSVDRLPDDDPRGDTTLEDVEADALEKLGELGDSSFDLVVQREVRRGTPFREIVAQAENRDVDLVVLGSRGAGGSGFGSTSERVVAWTSTPTVVVPPIHRPPSGDLLETVDDVVVALDGSDTADHAGEHALGVAERFGSTLHAIYVVNSAVHELKDSPRSIVGMLKKGGRTTVEEYAENAVSREVSANASVVDGRPAEKILERVDEVDADVAVLGTRGKGAADDDLLGSTTRRVLHRAEIPVLSVS